MKEAPGSEKAGSTFGRIRGPTLKVLCQGLTGGSHLGLHLLDVLRGRAARLCDGSGCLDSFRGEYAKAGCRLKVSPSPESNSYRVVAVVQ